MKIIILVSFGEVFGGFPLLTVLTLPNQQYHQHNLRSTVQPAAPASTGDHDGEGS